MGSLSKLKNKIDKLDERFALGEINEELYKKCLANYQKQKLDVENEIDKVNAGLIERKQAKEELEKKVNDIPTMWQEGNLQVKRLIQSTVFPEGIYYNKQTDKLSVVPNNIVC